MNCAFVSSCRQSPTYPFRVVVKEKDTDVAEPVEKAQPPSGS